MLSVLPVCVAQAREASFDTDPDDEALYGAAPVRSAALTAATSYDMTAAFLMEEQVSRFLLKLSQLALDLLSRHVSLST